MNKRDLFAEISAALSDAKQHDQGKLTLKTHKPDKPEIKKNFQRIETTQRIKTKK